MDQLAIQASQRLKQMMIIMMMAMMMLMMMMMMIMIMIRMSHTGLWISYPAFTETGVERSFIK